MTKEQAERLYPLVNSKHWEAFVDYQRHELDRLHKDLEWQSDKELFKTQGMVIEIRRNIDLQQKIHDYLEG